MKSIINETINATFIQNVSSNLTFLGQSFPITNAPSIDIMIITLFTSFFITIVNKYLTDQVRIKALRVEMKELQTKMRSVLKTNPEKAKSIQGEIMKKNLENMKQTLNFKVMLITMVPLLIVFNFIRTYYSTFGDFFSPFGLVHWGWLGTYIFFSIFSSILMKKVLDVA